MHPVGRRNLRKLLLAAGLLVGTPAPVPSAIGLALVGGGGVLHLWSKGCLEQNRRLITAGPYRFTRNPFYLANALIDAGLCLVIGRVWLAAGFAVLWGLAYRDTIAAEEAKLRALFPDAFARYAARVPRFLPDGRSWPRDRVTGRFSFDNDGLARGQEYARLLGIALGPLVVWVGALVRLDGARILAGEAPLTLAAVVAVAALWVVKLGLSEVFRRPESVLVPGLPSVASRGAAWLTLVVAATLLWPGHPWASVLIAMWAGLVGLEALRVARLGVPPAPGRRWRYLAPVSGASVVAVLVLSWVEGGAV